MKNFPAEQILTQHVVVLGKTRSGKSSVLRLLVEGLLDHGQPVCIVDPKGDWWGIKLASDGRRPGYPVIIFGGEHADVPINEHAGAHVAELFATGNRPCLIDLGGWMVGPRTRFWIDFASTLFKCTKGQRWLAVDEVHNFAPKGKIFDVEAGKALHWTNRLASEGLGKGLALIIASQRPQKVHNDTLTSAETLIAMRVLHPSDRAAVSEWIKGCGDSDGGEVLQSLAQMDRGEGWMWSPEIGFGPKRVKFPMFKTYDSFRPQTVEDTRHLKGWAEVDLDDVRAKMAATIEKAKAEDPVELRRRIAELEREISRKPTAAPSKVERVEVDVLKAQDIQRLEKVVLKLQDAADGIAMTAKNLTAALRERQKATGAVRAAFRGEPPPGLPRLGRADPRKALSGPDQPFSVQRPQNGQDRLVAGERAILTAVAQHPDGATREQLSVLTGYRRSSRQTYLQKLKQRGFVEFRGDRILATAAGITELGPSFEPLPTGDALREHWLSRLPEGERRILDIVVSAWPDSVDRETLGEQAGYKRSSVGTYLQKLSAKRLVVSGSGRVAAARELFG